MLRGYFTRNYGKPDLELKRLKVTKGMLGEWEEISSGRKDVRHDLRTRRAQILLFVESLRSFCDQFGLWGVSTRGSSPNIFGYAVNDL